MRLERDDGTVIAESVVVATSPWRRFVGLMGRTELPAGHGLYLRPCNSIHTFFMRFPIDAVFVDKEGETVRVYEHIKPWRMTRLVRHAKACIELPAGTAASAGVAAGQRLRVV
jgi:uncharacterized protein